MEKKQIRKKYPCWVGLLFLSLAVFICSCQDDKTSSSGYDPSRPVIFADFSPNSGSIRTKFHIYGENFGTDPSKVRISIGGQAAKTIGCAEKEIYCMVPRRAFDGVVKVTIESSDGKSSTDYEFEKRFEYVAKTSVGTLCGKVNEYGQASNIDGTFEEAEFSSPEWLLLDTFGIEKCMYVTHPGTSIRKISLDNRTVSTVITNGQGSFRNMQFMTFDTTGDTIYISDDNGQNNREMMEIAYLLRSENFRKAQPYVYDRCGYSCAYQPLEKTLYYNTYGKAGIQKAVYDPKTKGMIAEEVFPAVYENLDDHTRLLVHPTGDYMYILGKNCIFKAIYNKETMKYQTPIVFAGQLGAGGAFVDGVGTTARFNWPFQGTFVKNKDYVKEGKKDIYDFYLCDRHNHCIRKITPEGIVSIYAGRGSASSDGQVWGYIDGDLRKDARFNQPCGIAYDEETEIFYVCEPENHRIRTISVE